MIAAAALCLLGACHKAAGTPAPVPECQTRADCTGGVAGGELCVAGQCQGCARSRDCALTEVCDPVQRRCVERACFGTQCTAHADCALGLDCVQGLCLDPAHAIVQQGTTCSVLLCASDSACNPGQRCNQRTFVCETDLGCVAGSPCAAGQTCNPGTGLCEAGCTPATQLQVCGPVVPCIAGRCVQCATDADCGPGLTCDAAAGQCHGRSACTGSRDCTFGTFCDRATGTCAPPRGACTSNETCAPDQRCQTSTGNCVSGACLSDRFDPNGSAARAHPLVPGSYPQLSLCGDEDWFSLQLLSGDRVQVVGDVDPLGSFDLSLLDGALGLLDEEPLAVLRTVGSAGTYYVRVRSNDVSAVYGLRVDLQHGSACAHNPPDPHPAPASALAVGPGPRYGLAVCPSEATWFLLRAAAGLGLDATASLDPTQGGALVLSLYDADGTTLLAQDASGSGTLHVAAARARAYLRVAGAVDTAQNHYDLTVRETTP